MFCPPGHIFDSTVCVGSHFHVLRSWTRFPRYLRRQIPCFVLSDHFRRHRRCRVPIYCFALPDAFLTISRASVSFLCFALSDSFSSVSRAFGPFFMFCAPRPIFGGTDGVKSRYIILRSRTHFRRYRRHQITFSCFALSNTFSAVPRRRDPFSCLALLDIFSAVPRASGHVFMF
jgi:hypothetical protein